nr:hypothetical protein [Heyndrickxia oleronia]
MEKQYFNLVQFFEGYVRNYRRMNLSYLHNVSMFTKREIDFFARLGEMLGFDAFIEDSKFDKLKGRSRPMDLSWWKWDARFEDEQFLYLALHLEREVSPRGILKQLKSYFHKQKKAIFHIMLLGYNTLNLLKG